MFLTWIGRVQAQEDVTELPQDRQEVVKQPRGISYQAVVRDGHDNIVSGKTISVGITLKAEVGGRIVAEYRERHIVKTNANGLFTLIIGQGESEDEYSEIDWSITGATYKIGTETEYGSGETQILSVPLARYAEKAGDIDYATLLSKFSSEDLAAIIGLADYLKKGDFVETLEEYAKTGEAETKLTEYAKTEDLPSLAGYAKTEDVEKTLEEYAKTGEVETKLTEYAKTEDLPSLAGYAKTDEVETILTEYVTIAKLKEEIDALKSQIAEMKEEMASGNGNGGGESGDVQEPEEYLGLRFPIENGALQEGADTLRILAIGNSFTDDPTFYLGGVVGASGIDQKRVCVYALTVGGDRS